MPNAYNHGKGAKYTGRSIDRQIKAAAWSEYRDNDSYRGIAPDASELRPPRWFVAYEIGFSLGPGDGPSLKWTCENLAKINRAAVAQLGFDAPRKTTYPLARRRRPTKAPDEPARESFSQMASRLLAEWGVKGQ